MLYTQRAWAHHIGLRAHPWGGRSPPTLTFCVEAQQLREVEPLLAAQPVRARL